MPSTSGRGRVRCAPWKTEQLSTGELCTGKAMDTHFYTAIFFFSFTRFFLWSCRKIKYYFFLCPVRISRRMNAKKVVIRQGRQRAMETHLYTMDFFFSFTIIFQWTSRTIPYYFFLSLVSIFRIMNAKISKFEREDKTNGNPLVHHGYFFFFHNNFPTNIQNDSLLFFFMPC